MTATQGSLLDRECVRSHALGLEGSLSFIVARYAADVRDSNAQVLVHDSYTP